MVTSPIGIEEIDRDTSADVCEGQHMTNDTTTQWPTDPNGSYGFLPIPTPTGVATRMGAIDGIRAAESVFDGNTSTDTYRTVLVGLDDGDPMVLDTMPWCDLSGEWADGTTSDDVIVGVLDMFGGADGFEHLFDGIVDAYVAAYDEHVSYNVERICHEHLFDHDGHP